MYKNLSNILLSILYSIPSESEEYIEHFTYSHISLACECERGKFTSR